MEILQSAAETASGKLWPVLVNKVSFHRLLFPDERTGSAVNLPRRKCDYLTGHKGQRSWISATI